MAERLRVLELFAGIGGCAAAIGDRADIVAAVDTDPAARSVYQHNVSHPVHADPIESLSTKWFQGQAADVWWLSPPTLPLAHAGLRRELDDDRAKAFAHVVEQIRQIKPRFVALESGVDFNKSLARQMLHETLTETGYVWQETTLCPTQLGMPNERPRFYLVAGQHELRPWKSPTERNAVSLATTLESSAPDDMTIAPELLAMHRNSMDIVSATDEDAISSCFTSDYGRSVNKTGSYLQERDLVRYFSPNEMLTQLGFPQWFELPADIGRETAWRLIGNSSSIPATRAILDAIPGLFTRELSDMRANHSLK